MLKQIQVDQEEAGQRVDHFLAEKSGFSRNRITQAIEAGQITLDGQPIKKKLIIKTGQVFAFDIQEPAPLKAEPENIPLKIIYEDQDIIVLNKQADLVVHPAPGNPSGTLVNALLAYCPDLNKASFENLRPGLVHRLDKDTSGVMVVAKNEKSLDDLARQIKNRQFHKIYWAVVYGIPKNKQGQINFPLGRNPRDRKKMAVIKSSKLKSRAALTFYKVLEEFSGAALLEVNIVTGRTHQIRIHLAHIGYPVMGDAVYTKRKTSLIGRQALHARRLGLTHPTSKKILEFTAELPQDMTALLEKLRKGGKVG